MGFFPRLGEEEEQGRAGGAAGLPCSEGAFAGSLLPSRVVSPWGRAYPVVVGARRCSLPRCGLLLAGRAWFCLWMDSVVVLLQGKTKNNSQQENALVN